MLSAQLRLWVVCLILIGNSLLSMGQTLNRSAADELEQSIRQARTAANSGYFMCLPILALTGAAVVTENTKTFGTITSGIVIISPIIVHNVGKNLRAVADVQGNSGLRFTAWVVYGIAVANVGATLGLYEENVPTGVLISAGFLGAASLALHSAEVSYTIREAEIKMRERRAYVKPSMGYSFTPNGSLVPVAGLTIAFR